MAHAGGEGCEPTHIERISSGLVDPDQLVELEVDGGGITVLGILDNKDHQERDDRCARINDELPGVGPTKERSRRGPQNDRQERQRERNGATELTLRPAREAGEERCTVCIAVVVLDG